MANPCIQCYANINCKGCITKIEGKKMTLQEIDNQLLITIKELKDEKSFLLKEITRLQKLLKDGGIYNASRT